jgi:phosphoenolpyruvate phosphomutase
MGRSVLRVAGVHDGVMAILAERHGFDGLWASGLGISAAHGVPDASILTMTEFLAAAVTVNQSSSLPVIADCDTGFGDVNNVARAVRIYEAAGIAGICIEDKVFPKRNSFRANQQLIDSHEFAAKIAAAKRAQVEQDFVVFARIEALIAGAKLDEALDRGVEYAAAGADAILIHSKATTAGQVIDFATEWYDTRCQTAPLVVVPTTYAAPLMDLERVGVRVVIFANQGLRATIRAVDEAFSAIAGSGSSEVAGAALASIDDVFALLATDQIESGEARARLFAQEFAERFTSPLSRGR